MKYHSLLRKFPVMVPHLTCKRARPRPIDLHEHLALALQEMSLIIGSEEGNAPTSKVQRNGCLGLDRTLLHLNSEPPHAPSWGIIEMEKNPPAPAPQTTSRLLLAIVDKTTWDFSKVPGCMGLGL